MNGFVVEDKILNSNGISVTSGTTVLSREFAISSEDSKSILVAVAFSALMENTGGSGSSIVLQDSPDGGTTWSTVQSATLTTVAEVNTLTFAAVGSLAASEYIVVYDYLGNPWACMLDTTGSDADPTGALWVAAGAGRRTKTGSLAGLNAAQVAAAVETAMDSMTGFTALITTDDTAANGTMLFTSVQAGVNLTKPASKLKDDSAAGNVTVAETTAGSFTAQPELENNMAAGTDTAIWPLARVVITMDTNDTATVSNVYVSRRF